MYLDFFHFWQDCWPWFIEYVIRLLPILVLTLPWIFKVKYGSCYILAKNSLIAMKWKANISPEHQASNMTIWFDLGHDHGLEFSRSNMEFAISQPKKVLIATKRKANISPEHQASNMTIWFDLGYDLDLKFSRSNMEFAKSYDKMIWLPQNKKWTYWLNTWPQM